MYKTMINTHLEMVSKYLNNPNFVTVSQLRLNASDAHDTYLANANDDILRAVADATAAAYTSAVGAVSMGSAAYGETDGNYKYAEDLYSEAIRVLQL